MAIQLTADRVRSMISGCRSDQQVLSVLKKHKVSYKQAPFSEGYMLNLRIPCRTGVIRIYRCCSRRSPYVVQLLTPVMMTPSGIPVFRPSIRPGAPFTGI